MFEDTFKFSRHLKEKSVLANGRQLCDIIHTQAAMTGDSSISRCRAALVPAHNVTIPALCKQVNVAKILVFPSSQKTRLKTSIEVRIKIVC